MNNKEDTNLINSMNTNTKKRRNLDNYSFITPINDEFLSRVESNIADISAYRTFALTDKVIIFLSPYFNHTFKIRVFFLRYWKTIKKLCITVLSIALFVFVIRIFIEPTDSFAWFLCIGYIILIILFLKMKPINYGKDIFYTASFKPNRSDRTRATRLVRIAKKETPFVASYNFEGHHLTYYRTTHTNEKLVWERNLKGFAMVHDNVTLLYSRKSNLTPTTLIMQHNNHEILDILENLEIEYFIYNFKSKTKNYYINRTKG